jgi:serine/threonine protein kinase/tetratricopeptide (TPR) repeat protein
MEMLFMGTIEAWDIAPAIGLHPVTRNRASKTGHPPQKEFGVSRGRHQAACGSGYASPNGGTYARGTVVDQIRVPVQTTSRQNHVVAKSADSGIAASGGQWFHFLSTPASSTMSEHASRKEALFAEALELPSAERRTFLAQACGTDCDLLDRLLELLAAHSRAEKLEPPIAVQTVMTEEKPGDNIGQYKLLQRIGEGGCGVVWMAEQEEPLRRQVALKVIKLGMDTKTVIARFEAERQALAMMDHPNIAKVLDAGSSNIGRPFFVMEFVRGIPITKFCDERNLAAASRLELFARVCRAIQHAHQKGIVHRDIKPSNILVAVHDDVPVPKVIDFGIAKATANGTSALHIVTLRGEFIGTPAYMSPEQAQLNDLDIDTRSDIYSLGVLLYELLTGGTPFDSTKLLNAGLDEFRRHVREVDPPRPSTRLSTMKGDTLGATAQHRQIAPLKLIKLVRGELDWIVMRCLEKDRAHRYETASGLANDITRYLKQEPISASPPGTVYRFQKLVRRNRVAFAGVAAVTFALMLGLVVSVWQAIRANRAEQIARRAEEMARSDAAIAKAVNEFLLSDLLRQADSHMQAKAEVTPNPDLKVREALDRAAEKVGTRFSNQPLTEAAVRSIIGNTYGGLGEYATASHHHERALEIRKRLLGGEHPDTLSSMDRLADTFAELSSYEKATALHLQTLETRRRVLGAEHPSTASSMNGLAGAYYQQGKYGDAEILYAQSLEIAKRLFGAEHRATLSSVTALAMVYAKQGRVAEAEKLDTETLEIRKRVLGVENPDTLASMHALAARYYSQGKYAEAEKLDTETLEIRKRVLGPEHPLTLSSMNNLANVYSNQNKKVDAEKLYLQAIEILKRVVGPEHPDTLRSKGNLAIAYRAQGKYTEAAKLHVENRAIRERVLGVEHPDTLRSMNDLAITYSSQGKKAEAAALHGQTLEVRTQVLGAEHPETLRSMSNVAETLASQGKHGEAATLQGRALEIRKRVLGPEHPDTLHSMKQLAVAYRSLGKHVEAATLLAQTLAVERRSLGDEHPGTLASMHNLAMTYRLEGRIAEAVVLHEETLAARKRVLGPEDIDTARSMGELANSYRAQGKTAEAIALHASTAEIRKRVLGLEHPETLGAMNNLAIDYGQAKELSKAEAVYRELLTAKLKKEGPESSSVADARGVLGKNLLDQRKYSEAEPVLREALVAHERTLPDNWQTFNTRSLLGSALAGQKKFSEAEPLLVSGYDGMKQREATMQPPNRMDLRRALERLVQLYSSWGQIEKTEVWKRELARLPPTAPANGKKKSQK